MASVIRFVDSIAASPTPRLNLNNITGINAFAVDVAGIDLSPPPMRRAVSSTMMVDGDHIGAAAFENRTIRMKVRLIRATTTDAAATAVQDLARELNRPTNILQVQLDGATSPVFFRTYRAPDYVLSMLRLLFTPNTAIDLELPAEPFALGLQETPVSNVTINTNPAAGGNDCFVDVSGVKGDVETPVYLRWPSSAAVAGNETLIAVRRRGAPSATPFLFQAELLTQGTNTTTQANDANFSGGGNNWSRCTFGTATLQTRLSTSDIGTASVNLRGRYRVFLRYRQTVSGDDINIQLRWGTAGVGPQVFNTAYNTPNTTAITTADLGEVSIPHGYDPVTGPDGVELNVSDSFSFAVLAERVSGSGNLDFDFLVFVPADDRLAIVKWTDDAGDHWYLDARDNSAHCRSSAAGNPVISAGPPAVIGGFPMLTPNQINRVYLIRSMGASDSWTLTTVANVYIHYWPRYLSIRPVST